VYIRFVQYAAADRLRRTESGIPQCRRQLTRRHPAFIIGRTAIWVLWPAPT